MDFNITKNTMDIYTWEDDCVCIESRDLRIVVKHNDIGVSIDVYPNKDTNDTEPSIEITEHFKEYRDE